MRSITVLTFLTMCAASLVFANVPTTISYQGLLTTSTGDPVPNGSYTISVRIFNTAVGGSELWSEVQAVATSNGLFSTSLGSTNPIPDSALSDTAAYLEIALDPDPPMSPRTRLSSVPYSRRSEVLRSSHVDPSSGETGEMFIGKEPSSGPKPEHTWKASVSNPTAGTSATTETFVSADSGVIQTTTAENASGQATGKRQHRPVSITKELGASTSSASVELLSKIHADSGFVDSRLLSNPVATVESHENGHALGVGHLELLKKVSDPGTGSMSQFEMWLEPDSGVTATTTAETATGQATGKRQYKPLTIKASSMATTASDTAFWSRSVDADSGYTDSVRASDGSHSMETIAKVRPLQKKIDYKAGSSDGNTADAGSFLSVDSGYSETATMSRSDLIAGISHGVSQTREHVLLSRQVGVPGATDDMSLELQNSSSGPSMTMDRTSGSETAGIEMMVSDTAEWLALTTTTGTTKYSNITLKRGIVGSSIGVSHVGAGANDGVFISSNAAAGGAIGINTSTPTLPFYLVGSGCYTGTFGACSDRRFKERITPLSDPLATIGKLNGVSYYWKRQEYPDRRFPEGRQIGLIAQEVEAILPEIVLTDADGYKSIDYAKLTPVLVEAIKTQQSQIKDLNHRLDAQQTLIEELQAAVRQLAARSNQGNPSYGSR